jgi:hypothetical protein
LLNIFNIKIRERNLALKAKNIILIRKKMKGKGIGL